jgi:spermidine/putrescine transport system substrate-binding protein
MLLAACGGGTAAQPTQAPADAAPTQAPAGDAAPTQAPAGDAAPTQAPAGDGATEVDRSKLSAELRVYNWTDYIDPAVIEDFESEYGVKVILDLYESNEDMIAKVQSDSGAYDIVVPSDYAVETMWRANMLAELDKSMLPNMSHLDPGLLGKYFDEQNTYSVPYMYGITGIAYNKAQFAELGLPAPDSWSALFDPAQIKKYEENNRQFSMLDDERETPGAALRSIGKSLNDTDPANLTQVEQILTTQKASPAMAYNSSDVNRKLAGGDYIIAHAWSGMAMQARNGLGDEFAGNPDIEFVMPKEGGMIWMDNMAIMAGSPNIYTAHVFINYLLQPEIAARNTEYIGYLTPNKDAVPLLSEEVKALYAQGFAPDEAMYERLEWAIRNESTSAFTELWTRVKGE